MTADKTCGVCGSDRKEVRLEVSDHVDGCPHYPCDNSDFHGERGDPGKTHFVGDDCKGGHLDYAQHPDLLNRAAPPDSRGVVEEARKPMYGGSDPLDALFAELRRVDRFGSDGTALDKARLLFGERIQYALRRALRNQEPLKPLHYQIVTRWLTDLLMVERADAARQAREEVAGRILAFMSTGEYDPEIQQDVYPTRGEVISFAERERVKEGDK